MIHYIVVLEDVTYEDPFWNPSDIQEARGTFDFNPLLHTVTIL